MPTFTYIPCCSAFGCGCFQIIQILLLQGMYQYMAKNPGRVITEDILSSLVGNALAQSLTPINIFGGFKNAGIYPFNPGEVSDRQLAPSKAHNNQLSQVPLQFSPEQVTQFEKQYTEGYDVPDPNYLAWKNIHHPSPLQLPVIHLHLCHKIYYYCH